MRATVVRRMGATIAGYLLLAATAGQAGMPLAFDMDAVDVPACAAYADGKEVAAKADPGLLAVSLGLKPGRDRQAWDLGESTAKVRHYRVVFKQPVPVGSIAGEVFTGPEKRPLQPLFGRYISLLKADAPLPGDVLKEEQWTILPPGQVKTLPAGCLVRAVRFSYVLPGDGWSDYSGKGQTTPLAATFFFRERYYNPLDVGFTHHTGENKPGKTENWYLYWNAALSIPGMLFYAYEHQLRIQVLAADSKLNALVAGEADWQKVAEQRLLRWSGTLVVFAEPLQTKALRLTGPSTQPHEGGRFGTYIALAALGPGEEPPNFTMPPPPVTVKYDMPMDGFAAVQLHDPASGKLVRRLYAEFAKEKGATADGWDLKDEGGNYVAPGDYEWRALVRPPFKLTYEMTANNAGQPGWWAPPPGKGGGGWLGDHGTPNCAAAMGDIMWFGTGCAENGHVAIATDLEGNKLWGTHHIAWGFCGPFHITCDDKAAYLETADLIQRVVPSRDFNSRCVFNCRPTETLPWNPRGNGGMLGGVAARDGKLYYAVNAPPENWFKSAFPADTIDPQRCLPAAGLVKGKGRRSARGDRNYIEGEYDELMKLWATFLTEKTPAETQTLPDTDIPSSTQAYLGDAPGGGQFAGSVVVGFKKPVLVGSVLVPDAKIKVYALKPGLKVADVLKANMEEGTATEEKDAVVDEGLEEMTGETPGHEQWLPLEMSGTPGQPGIAAAPAGGVQTTALRYKVRRLLFSQVVTRRFRNCAADATLVAAVGAAAPGGGWHLETGGEVICPIKPVAVALVWPKAQSLRGITFSRPALGEFAVDLWKGASGADVKAALTDDAQWENVGTLTPAANFLGFFYQEPTCRHLDFGAVRQVSAVRVRILRPNKGEGPNGFDGIAAWTPIGEDPKELPVYLNARISVLQMPPLDDDKTEATILRHIPLPKPNALAFDTAGTLYCVSDNRVVTVPLDGQGEPTVVVPAGVLKRPTGLAVDAGGLVYVADAAERVIKVFDQAGKLSRTVGAGLQQLGPWDPARLDHPMQIAIDRNVKLWVADSSYQPKRVARFTPDGKPDRSFLGPTQYGGGGWMDSQDRSLVYYNGMKFVLDWQKRDWKLASLVYRPGHDPRSLQTSMPDRVVYCQGRRYLVGPAWGAGEIAVICEERNDIAVPVAAAGGLAKWDDVDTRGDLATAFGGGERETTAFVWSDKNGDGLPQPAEVQLMPNLRDRGWNVGEDLTFYATERRLRPTGIQPNGVPTYDVKKLEPFKSYAHGPGRPAGQNAWGTEDGRIFLVGTRLVAADGQTQLWEYYNDFACHEGFYKSRFGYNRPPGVLNQEHKIIGHFRVGPEEYFVTNTDQGDWFTYTADGMFLGCIFGGPAGYGLRRWTLPEWEPGKVDLSDVRLPQEHYQGCVVRAEDTDQVYAVAGHNHMSIVRVDGFKQVQRLKGKVSVAAADLARTRDWELQKAKLASLRQEQKAARVPFLLRSPEINGALDVWPPDVFVTIHETIDGSLALGQVRTEHAKGALAYNSDCLLVAGRVLDASAMRNAAQDPTRIFQGGDAFDVTLGLDPNADPARMTAAAGDIRLLFASIKGKPTCVMFKPVAPEAPPETHARFESPVGATYVDRVAVIPEARIAFGSGADLKGNPYWTITASVPWKALGVKPPEAGARLRGDLGVLQSDPHGVNTASRLYWAAKGQTVVCDVPSETRLTPALWGEFYFQDYDKKQSFAPDAPGEAEPEAPPEL